MLTKVDVDNLQGSILELPLQSTNVGYILKNIEGLNPVKATIVSSSFAQLDGSQPQSARRENRNLIFTIGIEPYSGGNTVQSLRSTLYAYFTPKTFVDMKFYLDGVYALHIQGQVESCEASLFSKDPQLDISIICFDPNFLDPAVTIVSGNTVPSSSNTEQTINYKGTIETGYLLTLNVNRSITGFSTYMRRPDNSVAQLDFTANLLSGDVVKISTEARNKYATLTRSNVASSALFYVSNTSKWGALYPGNNYFRVKQNDTGAVIPFTLSYTAKYGGL